MGEQDNLVPSRSWAVLAAGKVRHNRGPPLPPTLTCVLTRSSATCRVRHEAAEALGAIASSETVGLLKEYAGNPDLIVAHSCQVALDMLEFEKSGGFQYAEV